MTNRAREDVTPAEHNDRRWLKVVHLERQYPWLQGPNGRFICGLRDPGWYVIRICPCHPGAPVTRPLPNRASAHRAMWAMLQVSAARGELEEAPRGGSQPGG